MRHKKEVREREAGNVAHPPPVPLTRPPPLLTHPVPTQIQDMATWKGGEKKPDGAVAGEHKRLSNPNLLWFKFLWENCEWGALDGCGGR